LGEVPVKTINLNTIIIYIVKTRGTRTCVHFFMIVIIKLHKRFRKSAKILWRNLYYPQLAPPICISPSSTQYLLSSRLLLHHSLRQVIILWHEFSTTILSKEEDIENGYNIPNSSFQNIFFPITKFCLMHMCAHLTQIGEEEE